MADRENYTLSRTRAAQLHALLDGATKLAWELKLQCPDVDSLLLVEPGSETDKKVAKVEELLNATEYLFERHLRGKP